MYFNTYFIWFIISKVTFGVKYPNLMKEKEKKRKQPVAFSLIVSNIKHLEAITCHAAQEVKYLWHAVIFSLFFYWCLSVLFSKSKTRLKLQPCTVFNCNEQGDWGPYRPTGRAIALPEPPPSAPKEQHFPQRINF